MKTTKRPVTIVHGMNYGEVRRAYATVKQFEDTFDNQHFLDAYRLIHNGTMALDARLAGEIRAVLVEKAPHAAAAAFAKVMEMLPSPKPAKKPKGRK